MSKSDAGRLVPRITAAAEFDFIWRSNSRPVLIGNADVILDDNGPSSVTVMVTSDMLVTHFGEARDQPRGRPAQQVTALRVVKLSCVLNLA